MTKKSKITKIIPGVLYEVNPDEATELGAFYDPAASEISLDEDKKELELINSRLNEIEEGDKKNEEK